jgi:peptide/nickel transport system substrate-binding protein
VTRGMARPVRPVLGGLLVISLLVAACTDGGGGPTPADTGTQTGAAPTETAAEPRRLIIGTNNQLVSFDPSGAETTLDWSVIGNFNGSLYRAVNDGDPAPDMAEGPPEISADGLTYTVRLREDIQFGDGLEFNAPMYVEQFQRTLDYEGLGASIRVTPYVESVEATDDYTLVFHLTDVFPFFETILTYTEYGASAHPDIFLPEELVNLPEAPIYGTGPYFVSEYDLTEGRITLEPNENYYGEAPPWNPVVWRIFDDPQTMALSLENGEIDVAWKTLGEDQLASLRDNPDVTVAPFAEGLLYFIVNHAKAPSDDPRVNQAVAAVINREEVLDRALGGIGHQTLYSPIPPELLGSTPIFQTKFDPPNVEMAESLLAEAGYSRDNPVKIVLGYSTSQWGPPYRDVVDVIAEQLSSTGLFEVEVSDQEWETYLDGLLAGDTYNYGFLDKSPGIDPAQFTGLFVNETGVGTWLTDEDNKALFPEAQEIQDQDTEAATILDPEERQAAYETLGEMWAEIVVTIPLFVQERQLAYRSDRVMGDPAYAGSEALGIAPNDVFYYDRAVPVG